MKNPLNNEFIGLSVKVYITRWYQLLTERCRTIWRRSSQVLAALSHRFATTGLNQIVFAPVVTAVRLASFGFQYAKKLSRLFLCDVDGLANMTDAILSSFGKIEYIDIVREYLEFCLQESRSSIDTEALSFISYLAYTENKSIEEIAKYFDSIREILSKIKELSEQVKKSEDLKEQLKKLTLTNNLFLKLTRKYWIYLPPKAKNELILFGKKIKSKQNNKATIKMLLLLDQVTKNNHALVTYEKSITSLANAISKEAAQDLEDKIDLEKACAARERIKTEGTISLDDLKRELNLP